jgi:hypothetical protein
VQLHGEFQALLTPDNSERENIPSLTLKNFSIYCHESRQFIITAKLVIGEFDYEISRLQSRSSGG